REAVRASSAAIIVLQATTKVMAPLRPNGPTMLIEGWINRMSTIREYVLLVGSVLASDAAREALGGRMIRAFDEGEWERTVYLIRERECTPFIGAGTSSELVRTGDDLAADLA